MWHRLRRQIEIEQEQLSRLLATHRELLGKCKSSEPGPDETAALAAVLHSFYTGIENLFKRIAAEIDHSVPRGEYWHSELLERMTQPNPERPAVISESLSERLQEYLDFRHVFRHAYSFELHWNKMTSLVHNIENVYQDLKQELDGFIRAVDSRH